MKLTGCDTDAGSEGISLITWVAPTLRRMVGDRAGGVVPADTRTRVHTVLVDAGKMSCTLCIDHTLWLTLDIRVSCIVCDASAAGCLVDLPADGVDTAG